MIPSYSLSLLNVIPFKIFFFSVYRFLSSFVSSLIYLQSRTVRLFHVSRVINSVSKMLKKSQTDSIETFLNKTVSKSSRKSLFVPTKMYGISRLNFLIFGQKSDTIFYRFRTNKWKTDDKSIGFFINKLNKLWMFISCIL